MCGNPGWVSNFMEIPERVPNFVVFDRKQKKIEIKTRYTLYILFNLA